MTIKMKALRSFGGRHSTEGHVKRGREFEVHDIGRAKELEAHGYAYRLQGKAEAGAPLNKMEAPSVNKAAEAGPFDLAGGRIGDTTSAPSLLQAPRPRRRRSSSSEDESAS